MSGRDVHEVWEATQGEGQRRLDRSAGGLLATGFVGGVDVTFGILALVVLQGGLAHVLPTETAHVLASAAFGIGFVFILIGRSELFTENFLVPVSTVMDGRRPARSLARLWGLTLAGNIAGLLVLAFLLTRPGLLPVAALRAADAVGGTLAGRDAVAALLSAVVAGAVMTLMTWLAHAAREESAKLGIGLMAGFVLAAPSLNHAVVGVGEMAFAAMTPAASTSWTDVAENLPWAVLGNLIGGLGLVTAMRLVQVRGEPE